MDIVRLIATLHDTDRKLAEAERTLVEVRERPTRARSALESALRDQQSVRDLLDATEQKRRDASRKLETYERRRDQAQRALDAGMGDAAAAERQIAQCSEILDEIETEILEYMEHADEQETALASTTEHVDRARAQSTAEDQEFERAEAPAMADHATAKAAREAAWSLIPRDIQSRYAALIQRRGTAVTALYEGACRSCRMFPGVELRRDHDRGLLVSCRGCGRWLIPDAS